MQADLHTTSKLLRAAVTLWAALAGAEALAQALTGAAPAPAPKEERPVGPPLGTPGVIPPVPHPGTMAPAALGRSNEVSRQMSARADMKAAAPLNDDAIRKAVEAKFAESRNVDAKAVKVESLSGTVSLSGFARSPAEKASAAQLAKSVQGVKEVKNQIAVRP
jgi:hypothetical protein